MRLVALLLVIQAAALIGIGLVYAIAIHALPWLDADRVSRWLAAVPLNLTTPWARLLEIEQKGSPLTIVLLPLGIMAFLIAVGFCRRRLFLWTMAMIVQSIHLFIAIVLYLTTRPACTTPLMLYGVIMVLYLNYSEVANAFHPAGDRA